MKKAYEEPVLEIVELESEDVLSVSVDKTNVGTLPVIEWSSLT